MKNTDKQEPSGSQNKQEQRQEPSGSQNMKREIPLNMYMNLTFKGILHFLYNFFYKSIYNC